MSEEQKKIAEKSEKFYQTADFKNLSPKEKKEKLTQHAQKIKQALHQNYKNILQNTQKTALAVGGAYIGYRILRWVFGTKKNKPIISTTKTIIIPEKKQKSRSFFGKIQNKIFDFVWDIAIETLQEQLISRFFKKKKKKKNGKKDS